MEERIKKRVGKTVSSVLTACLLFSGFMTAGTEQVPVLTAPLRAAAAETEEELFEYTVNEDGTVTITGYHGTEPSVTIPDELGGGRVTEIGDGAFFNCLSMTQVTIPDSVVILDGWAFCNCANLTEVNVLDHLQRVGNRAFANCTSLREITFGGQKIVFGAKVFDGDQLTVIGPVRSSALNYAKKYSLAYASVQKDSVGSTPYEMILSADILLPGQEFTAAADFPGGTNVGFCTTLPLVWEIGDGSILGFADQSEEGEESSSLRREGAGQTCAGFRAKAAGETTLTLRIGEEAVVSRVIRVSEPDDSLFGENRQSLETAEISVNLQKSLTLSRDILRQTALDQQEEQPAWQSLVAFDQWAEEGLSGLVFAPLPEESGEESGETSDSDDGEDDVKGIDESDYQNAANRVVRRLISDTLQEDTIRQEITSLLNRRRSEWQALSLLPYGESEEERSGLYRSLSELTEFSVGQIAAAGEQVGLSETEEPSALLCGVLLTAQAERNVLSRWEEAVVKGGGAGSREGRVLTALYSRTDALNDYAASCCRGEESLAVYDQIGAAVQSGETDDARALISSVLADALAEDGDSDPFLTAFSAMRMASVTESAWQSCSTSDEAGRLFSLHQAASALALRQSLALCGQYALAEPEEARTVLTAVSDASFEALLVQARTAQKETSETEESDTEESSHIDEIPATEESSETEDTDDDQAASMRILVPMTKQQAVMGELPDLTGLQLQVTDRNGGVTTVTSGYIAAYDPLHCGVVRMIVFYGGLQSETEFRIAEPEDIRLTGEGSSVKMLTGTGRDLSLRWEGSPSMSRRLEYVSTNPSAADVDEHGYITAKAPGRTTIEVTSPVWGQSMSVTVTVRDAVTLTEQEKTVCLTPDRTAWYRITLSDSTPVTMTITDPDGRLLCDSRQTRNTYDLLLREGEEYTMKAAGLSGAALLQVKEWKIAGSLNVTDDRGHPITSLTGLVGETKSLAAVLPEENCLPEPIVWSSDDACVRVSEAGVLTFESIGTAQITAMTSHRVKKTITVHSIVLPASVTLNQEELDLTVGETAALEAMVLPEEADDRNVTWLSSDEAVAAVSHGEVTAKSVGTAVITAETVNGLQASCTVTVKAPPIPVTKVTLDKSSAAIGLGETLTLKATVTPSDAADRRITWSSTNPDVASVSSGRVTGQKIGTAVIKATSSNGLTASCLITVRKPAENLTLNYSSLTLGRDETIQLKSSVTSGTSYQRTFTSNNVSVVKIISRTAGTCTLKAVKPGSAVITVRTFNGITASCRVTVREAPTEITLNQTSMTMGRSETYKLISSIKSGASFQRTFATSNANVVKITATTSGTCTIQAVGTGTAVITVTTYSGLTARCRISVKEPASAITLNQSSMTMGQGETYKLLSSVKSGASFKRTFTTSNSRVVKITKTTAGTCTIQAVGTGTATVTVRTFNGKTAKCVITVKTAAADISLERSGLTLGAGETYQFTSSIRSGASFTRQFQTSNSSVVKILSSDGNNCRVQAVKPGTAMFSVTTFNGKTFSCRITVKTAAASISLDKILINLKVGERQKITSSVKDGASFQRTFSTSDFSTVRIVSTTTGTCTIEGVRKGTAVITVKTFNGKTARCKVVVS